MLKRSWSFAKRTRRPLQVKFHHGLVLEFMKQTLESFKILIIVLRPSIIDKINIKIELM